MNVFALIVALPWRWRGRGGWKQRRTDIVVTTEPRSGGVSVANIIVASVGGGGGGGGSGSLWHRCEAVVVSAGNYAFSGMTGGEVVGCVGDGGTDEEVEGVTL